MQEQNYGERIKELCGLHQFNINQKYNNKHTKSDSRNYRIKIQYRQSTRESDTNIKYSITATKEAGIQVV